MRLVKDVRELFVTDVLNPDGREANVAFNLLRIVADAEFEQVVALCLWTFGNVLRILIRKISSSILPHLIYCLALSHPIHGVAFKCHFFMAHKLVNAIAQFAKHGT